MYLSDPTAALRLIAERVRPGGVVAFHEGVAVSSASAMNYPVLVSLQDLIRATFRRSGARLDMGAELHWRMRDAGLEPEPKPLAEMAVCTAGAVAHRYHSLTARSMLPKIVEYGLATEEELLDTVERLYATSWLIPGASSHCPGY